MLVEWIIQHVKRNGDILEQWLYSGLQFLELCSIYTMNMLILCILFILSVGSMSMWHTKRALSEVTDL